MKNHCASHFERIRWCMPCQAMPKVWCSNHFKYESSCVTCHAKNNEPWIAPSGGLTLKPTSTSTAETVSLAPDELLGHAFVQEIGSERLRAWWKEQFSYRRVAEWIASSSDSDLLEISTLSPAGFDLACQYRAAVAAAKEAEVEAVREKRRRSLTNARRFRHIKKDTPHEGEGDKS